jgi:hypothetical protein
MEGFEGDGEVLDGVRKRVRHDGNPKEGTGAGTLFVYIQAVVTGAALPSAERHIKLTSSTIIGPLREDSPDSQDTGCVRMRRLLGKPHSFPLLLAVLPCLKV